MYEIKRKRALNAAQSTIEMVVEAPLAARKCLPGQFVIIRLDEYGERIPLTIAGWSRSDGTVTIMFQPVGKTTRMLALMEEGAYISDVVGPLGKPTEMEGLKRVIVVGGGVGCAIAYPVAKGMFGHGIEVDMIAGFRSRDIVMLEDEMREASTNLYVMTDDGTYGERGFTTDKLKELLSSGRSYDRVFAVGPVPMMKFACAAARPYGVPTVASLNPVMVDGTGMCGACRVSVGGETKFACVDGPEFDGYQVDWDELMKRNALYRDEESAAGEHICRITGGVRENG